MATSVLCPDNVPATDITASDPVRPDRPRWWETGPALQYPPQHYSATRNTAPDKTHQSSARPKQPIPKPKLLRWPTQGDHPEETSETGEFPPSAKIPPPKNKRHETQYTSTKNKRNFKQAVRRDLIITIHHGHSPCKSKPRHIHHRSDGQPQIIWGTKTYLQWSSRTTRRQQMYSTMYTTPGSQRNPVY